uniref:Solute carrier family 66 member 3 n=1 Tax=Oncorhynchus tshawytscha TaxID=74940 RepID=A0AAZ3R036_ONCTS
MQGLIIGKPLLCRGSISTYRFLSVAMPFLLFPLSHMPFPLLHLSVCQTAQLPQLWKVLRARSASGISWWSVLLQVYAITGPVVYCITNNFPLEYDQFRFFITHSFLTKVIYTNPAKQCDADERKPVNWTKPVIDNICVSVYLHRAWSERLFMFMQGLAMGFLIQHYSGNTLKGIVFLLAYGGVMLLLTSPLVPEHVIPAMQASSMLAVVASRVIQAGTNYYHGNTGQLSALSVFLVFTGSLALIFTSLQETGDWSSVSTVTHVVAACLSCLLLTQVVCYRNSRTKDKTE